MSTARVNVDKLMLEIRNQYQNWYDVLTTDMQKEVIEKTAERTVKVLNKTSPRGRRRNKYYAITWDKKKDPNIRGVWRYSMVVYNENNYRLTHLLEYGHVTRSGTRTKQQPHIASAEQVAYDEIYDRVLDVISKSV